MPKVKLEEMVIFIYLSFAKDSIIMASDSEKNLLLIEDYGNIRKEKVEDFKKKLIEKFNENNITFKYPECTLGRITKVTKIQTNTIIVKGLHKNLIP